MMNASDEEDAEEYMRNREGVLRVAGRTLSSEDLRDLAAKENATDVITAFGSPQKSPEGFKAERIVSQTMMATQTRRVRQTK